MTFPMPPDAPAKIKAQAIKQDSDPAVKLRHLIQCRAYPGERYTERMLELVDQMKREVEQYREALEFYASSLGWTRSRMEIGSKVMQGDSPCECDRGIVAREALVSGDPSQSDT